MYEELVKKLRYCGNAVSCLHCPYWGGCGGSKEDLIHAADAIEELSKLADNGEATYEIMIRQTSYIEKLKQKIPCWIPVTERLPECKWGAEVRNIEWISCGMVHAGCFGRGGKYRDAYFRTWTDAGEGTDAKDADYWRAVTLPEPPKDGEP